MKKTTKIAIAVGGAAAVWYFFLRGRGSASAGSIVDAIAICPEATKPAERSGYRLECRSGSWKYIRERSSNPLVSRESMDRTAVGNYFPVSGETSTREARSVFEKKPKVPKYTTILGKR